EARPPTREVEPAERLDFMTFHVDGEEIDRRRRLGVDEDLIDRHQRHLERSFGLHTGNSEPRIERGETAGKVQHHALAGSLGRGARHRVDFCAALLAQQFGQVRLRLDHDAAPAHLLEMEGLRPLLRIVRSDFDEVAGRGTLEECLLEAVLLFVRKNGRHRGGIWSAHTFSLARERPTISLVLWPGTKSTRMTSPPSASTSSRPTTWSSA